MEGADHEQSQHLDSMEQLLDRGHRFGYVTLDEIQAALAETGREGELYSRQADDLFRRLEEAGTPVHETEAEAPAAEARTMHETPFGDNAVPHRELSQVPTGDFVGLYFAEIGRLPLLTHAEEVQLAKRMERGREAEEILSRNCRDVEEAERLQQASRRGSEARDYLIRANTRLVVSIVKKYRGLGLPFLDLVQVGNLGLIKAADKYDYRRGTRFSTLATWWIRQAVMRSLGQHGRTIRLPIYVAARLRKLRRAQQSLAQSLGRDPTPEEIAGSLGTVSPARVRWMLRVARRPLSLERPIGEDGDDELGSLIEDTTSLLPAATTERELLRDEMARMLEGLPPREVRAVRMRFGLDGGRPLSLKEMGDRMGVTRERARQIVVKALRRLRHPRRSRHLLRYLK